MKIIFAGSGAFGLPTFGGLIGAGHEIVGVYTQPDRPAGRGKQLTATPVAAHAESVGLTAVRTADINGETLPAADVMVVIAFGQKIAERVVRHPRLGSVNLHASQLPKYRGAAPINWAVINGDAVAGNSVIRLANKMDAGAVLGMSSVPIGESETAGELHDRLAADGGPLVLSVLLGLENGSAVEAEQDHAAATVAPKLSRETATIDWSQPATVVARRINGLSPWPGCRVTIGSAARVTLLRAEPVSESNPAGMLVDGRIGCGAGSVRVIDVLPEGRRVMGYTDFARGRAVGDGALVVSV